MLDPELADGLVRTRERHVVLDVLVAEERRVEVEADALFFGEVNPCLEVFRLDLIAVDLLIRDAVRCVQIELVLARDQGIRLADIGHELFWIAGASRVVARRRDAARQCIGVKTEDIITLPAVHRDAHLLQFLQGLFYIYTNGCIRFFCFFKSRHEKNLLLSFQKTLFLGSFHHLYLF